MEEQAEMRGSIAKTTEPVTTLIPYNDLERISKAVVACGFFPDRRSLSQAIVCIQAGAELGFPPVYAMQRINIIKGKVTLAAETMAALIKRSPKYNYYIKELTNEACTIEFLEGGKVIWTQTWTMEDAKRAGLIKPDSGWAKYPRDMLYSRCISAGSRKACPDLMLGAYTPEELGPEDAIPKITVEPLDTMNSTPEVVEGTIVGEGGNDVTEPETPPKETKKAAKKKAKPEPDVGTVSEDNPLTVQDALTGAEPSKEPAAIPFMTKAIAAQLWQKAELLGYTQQEFLSVCAAHGVAKLSDCDQAKYIELLEAIDNTEGLTGLQEDVAGDEQQAKL